VHSSNLHGSSCRIIFAIRILLRKEVNSVFQWTLKISQRVYCLWHGYPFEMQNTKESKKPHKFQQISSKYFTFLSESPQKPNTGLLVGIRNRHSLTIISKYSGTRNFHCQLRIQTKPYNTNSPDHYGKCYRFSLYWKNQHSYLIISASSLMKITLENTQF